MSNKPRHYEPSTIDIDAGTIAFSAKYDGIYESAVRIRLESIGMGRFDLVVLTTEGEEIHRWDSLDMLAACAVCNGTTPAPDLLTIIDDEARLIHARCKRDADLNTPQVVAKEIEPK